MKKMRCKTTGTIINVTRHIITRNFWEYYVTDDKFTDDIIRCLVMGDFTEMGDVSLNEVKPYAISATTKLDGVAPAVGWEWV